MSGIVRTLPRTSRVERGEEPRRGTPGPEVLQQPPYVELSPDLERRSRSSGEQAFDAPAMP
ncbi:hypothetical protein NHX12_017004, partial [Muraenolepis orangiensis]